MLICGLLRIRYVCYAFISLFLLYCSDVHLGQAVELFASTRVFCNRGEDLGFRLWRLNVNCNSFFNFGS